MVCVRNFLICVRWAKLHWICCVAKVNMNIYSPTFLWYRINSSCKLFMSILSLYWNGHNLFVQPASSRLFVRISLRCPLIITRYYVIRDVIVNIRMPSYTLLRNTWRHCYINIVLHCWSVYSIWCHQNNMYNSHPSPPSLLPPLPSAPLPSPPSSETTNSLSFPA